MERDSVSVAFVQEALDGLARRGVDADPLLAQAGIAAAVLQQPDSRIPAAAFARLWLGVAQATNDEFFACDRRPLKVGSFATLCHLALHARHLRQAMVRAARLMNLLLDDTHISLVLGEFDAELIFETRGNAPRVFAHETLFVLLNGLFCWLVGRRLRVRHAAFAYAPPAWATEYPLIYARDITFDAVQTRFAYDAVDLSAPVVQTERTARDFLRHAPANIIVKYKNAESLSAYLRRQLRSRPGDPALAFDAVAESLAISASTLRRRLDSEGTSYRLIKDGLRRDLAIRQLTQTRRPIAEIAAALGFAEPSAFHRAFRKWCGVSPGEYRRAQRRRTVA